MSVLERILAAKRDELPALSRRPFPKAPVRRRLDLRRPAGTRLKLIAEIKLRSPSAGPLSTKLGIAERAHVYEQSGADMISVLCDGPFFDGDYEHLSQARQGCELPLLCKEFVIDELQLDAARAYGADAVLLIVRCLSEPRVGELVAAARARQLVPLVEVVDERESRVAVDAGADLIGVNARDLDTLQMDVERAARVLAGLPDTIAAVHLSGLSQPSDVARVASSRADSALVGEALMRCDDPQPLLRDFVRAASAR
jgi:indole-3-glycerol phosphate synthase